MFSSAYLDLKQAADPVRKHTGARVIHDDDEEEPVKVQQAVGIKQLASSKRISLQTAVPNVFFFFFPKSEKAFSWTSSSRQSTVCA